MTKKLHIRLINKTTGEFFEYNTKEFSGNTPVYNDVVTSLVGHLHKVLDSPDEWLLVVDNVRIIEYVEGVLFDITG